MQKMTLDQAKMLMDAVNSTFDASIQTKQANAGNEISKLEQDLTIGRDRSNPLKVSFPFTSVRVEEASDTNVFVRLIPNSPDTNQEDVLLSLGDIFKNPEGIRECYIYWPAQPGKQIILKFFVSSTVENGSLVLAPQSDQGNFTLGFGNAKNDGFTALLYSAGPGGAAAGLNTFVTLNGCFNDTGYNTGTVNVGGPIGSQFQIPAGYQGELIGFKWKNFSAAAGVFTNLYFAALRPGDSFVSLAALTAAPRTIGFTTFSNVTVNSIGQSEYVLRASGAYTNVSPDRNRILFDELECVYPYFDKQGAAVATNTQVEYMIRLTPKVGA